MGRWPSALTCRDKRGVGHWRASAHGKQRGSDRTSGRPPPRHGSIVEDATCAWRVLSCHGGSRRLRGYMERYRSRPRTFAPLAALLLLLAACAPSGPARTSATPSPVPTVTVNPSAVFAYTPQRFRAIYGVDKLIARGDNGKGQTVVVIVSYGSPTLQQDVATFDSRFNLPPLDLRVLAPLGTVPFDPSNTEMRGWQGETTLDVETIHTIAPDAHVVVLTSPVDETEGTAGLPQFLQLEQYAVANKLGAVVSQSWEASEATLADSAGQQEVQRWTAFYKQATIDDAVTFVAASGDTGATDYTDATLQHLASTPTVGFPADVPWVVAAGGTRVVPTGANSYARSAWSGSEGGFSAFFAEPSYQAVLPASVQQQMRNRRGIPDVAAPADPRTGLEIYVSGSWETASGTSAATPFWAGVVALADQAAGHPLGFVNSALYRIGASSSYSQDFFDITSGNNSVSQQGVSVTGFNAVPGWDAVTGLGEPNVPNLVPALAGGAG
jgi:subtilase family serine protease